MQTPTNGSHGNGNGHGTPAGTQPQAPPQPKKPRIVAIRRPTLEDEVDEMVDALIPKRLQDAREPRDLQREKIDQATRDVLPAQNPPADPRSFLSGLRKKLSSFFR